MAGNSLSFITDVLWTSAFVMRKRAATTKIDLFAYLWQLPCALCSFILMTLSFWGSLQISLTLLLLILIIYGYSVSSPILFILIRASSSVPHKVIKAERQFHSGSPLRHYFTAAFYSSIAFSFNRNSYKPRCRIPSSSVHGFMDDLLMIIFLKKSFVFFRGLSSVSILDGSFTFRAD